ncbi:hypothetical protein MD535_25300 [Vibrio sp. ZSDZ65]|uniref:Uncharacterized protein n=1 Tax=Vibrio qingdaonensis TaxID=2829491 RepID=A0A9X3CT73_9VIBR|nr:hypothetical protein [Vibrio qingdaonensis]MCW8349301.1 hypothetical protein [Vibrio qingdaonensis]
MLLRLAPHENTDRMLAYMRARGKGNPQTYLSRYEWQAAQKNINDEFPVDIMQPIHKMVSYQIVENKSATKAFRQALTNAMNSNDFFQNEIVDGILHLNFDVEMESEHGKELNLHWYYQQSPEAIAPKRMLTSEGELEKTYYGMVDDKPSSI